MSAPTYTSPNSSSSDAISKLEQARRIALGDAAFYPQIVPGVLPLVTPSAPLEIRRWGSEFLAETFSSPSLAQEQKEQMALRVLPTVKEFLDNPGQDVAVLKSIVQTATSLYPLVFRHIIYHPSDSESWQKMVAIKSNILKRMDSSPSGVKVCCIKFIQRIVQVQTPGAIADPRRLDQNETSLSLVPNDHPVLFPSNLQAEAFGLLDRLLSVFQDTTSDDALFVTATLNSVGMLVRARASVANRILNAILNFNPFKAASSAPVTPRMKVTLKSMERTVRAFLLNLNKGNPTHPLAGRVQAYLDRLQQSRAELLEGKGRKRGAIGDPAEAVDSAKRQRLGADTPDNTPPKNAASTTLPPGSITMAQLYTLTENEAHNSFDARVLQLDALLRVLLPILGAVDQAQLDNAVNVVRARYLQYAQPQIASSVGPGQLAGSLPDDDEEYQPMDDAETIWNQLDSGPITGSQALSPPEVPLGPYKIPQPPPLAPEEVEEFSKVLTARLFNMIENAPERTSNLQQGLIPMATNSLDKTAWVSLVAGVATRPFLGFELPEAEPFETNDRPGKVATKMQFSPADHIRDEFHKYTLVDFRRRLDHAVTWLNEEWFAEKIGERQYGVTPKGQYLKHCLRLFDSIVPYLDAKDRKLLIRFVSEVPEITPEILERVKRLAQDPERVRLATESLLYLILLRPPVRTICIDAIEDLYLNYDDAKASAAKILQKWRPEVLQKAKPEDVKTETPTPGPGTAVAV